MQEMTSIGPGGKRKALKFGWHTLYLQEPGQPVPYEPKEEPVPGSASLCFVSDISFGEWKEHLNRCGVPIVEQPRQREGALGPITSFFIRDPDGNLLEIANYDI
jgi:catechol 2,3-dioxygenase-like lactoylglutathione lyase family enzyme